MSQLIIRGARIDHAQIYCSNNGQLTTEITFRAAWTELVCENMGWQKEPLGFGNGALDGKLSAINFTLEPSSKLLRDFRIDLTISQLGSFKHRAKTEDGVVTTRELEFTATSVAEDAPMVIARYIEKCGPGDDRGQMKVVYNAEEQPKLDGIELAAEDKPRGRKNKGAEAVQ